MAVFIELLGIDRNIDNMKTAKRPFLGALGWFWYHLRIMNGADIINRFGFLSHLLDRFDLEPFGVTLATHGTSYFGLIMRLGGSEETRGDSHVSVKCMAIDIAQNTGKLFNSGRFICSTFF